jgi:hypothetical protein
MKSFRCRFIMPAGAARIEKLEQEIEDFLRQHCHNGRILAPELLSLWRDMGQRYLELYQELHGEPPRFFPAAQRHKFLKYRRDKKNQKGTRFAA